jgi:hypothetical protein
LLLLSRAVGLFLREGKKKQGRVKKSSADGRFI